MKKQIKLLLDIINGLTKEATVQNSNAFFDELPVYFYSALLRIAKDNPMRKEGFEIYDKDIVAGGSSDENKMLGILKCAAELIERFCMFTFHPKNITFNWRNEMIKENACVDPNQIGKQRKNQIYGWVKGIDLQTLKDMYIPAQMVYLNYYNWAYKRHQEKKFIQQVSNGGCLGFTMESTVLRGIYELIERDAILTKYLAHLPLYKINMNSIVDEKVTNLNSKIKQYNFENILIDSTGDLGIPTYVSAAVDKSGILPSVTFGAKASLHQLDAIVGAIEESHMGRTWVRYELLNRNGVIPKINPTRIKTRLERAFFYADSKNSQPLLESLTESDFKFKNDYSKKQLDSDKRELAILLNLLKKKNIRVMVVDIKPSFLEKYPFFVYRIIMPDLQFLYLEENKKKINFKRINEVCHYYGSSPPTSLQEIPHFLL